jgi:hypothetical protein
LSSRRYIIDTNISLQGLKYFGIARDAPAADAAYIAVLSNTSEFGQITPANEQKVSFLVVRKIQIDKTSGMRSNPAMGPSLSPQQTPSPLSQKRMANSFDVTT